MFPYLIIYGTFSTLAMAIRRRQVQLLTLITLSIGLIFFTGTRHYVGCDYKAYWIRFEDFYFIPGIAHYMQLAEPSFHLLNLLVIEVGLEYMHMNLVASAIYIICIARFSWLHREPVMLLAMFFPVMIVQLGMSGLRQALAIGFIMVGWVQFTKKRKIATGVWILVAATFHTSAFMFLPVAFLAGARVSAGRLLLALLLMAPVATFLIGERLELYTDRYVDQIYGDQGSNGALLRYVLLIVPAVLFELYKQKLRIAFP
jgi:hypothetical protein